jgi:hypothetical protein
VPQERDDAYYVRRARLAFRDAINAGSIDIDDDARVVRLDDPLAQTGACVLAWVFVPDKEGA